MGKSNRIKSEKAAQPAKTVSTKTNKKKESSTLYSLLVAAIAVFVVVMVVVTTITSSGLLMRASKAIYSDNYKINGNMLKYMFVTKYEQFMNDYSGYMTYLSLDTTKPLKDQKFGENDDAALLGEFEGTWFDYFMSSAKTEAEQMLIYCEVADEKGITLDKDDKKEIDDAISQIGLLANSYGYTIDAYVTMLYGEGIKVKDIRSTIELSTLAAKCAEEIDAELMDKITDDRIAAKYEDNKQVFNVVDFAAHIITVEYNDVVADVIEGYDGKTELTDEQKATVLKEYEKRIEDAKAKAKVFEAYTTVEEFVNAMYDDTADTSFDELYEKEALADADKLSDADLAEIKAALIEKVIEEVKSGADNATYDTRNENGAYTAYGKTVTENAAKALDSIKENIFDSLVLVKDYYAEGQTKRDESDKFAKWAFEETTKVGDTLSVETGDGADDAEVKNESSYFDVSVYMIKATEYCDKTASKNVSYMSFTSLDSAKAAIESFKNNSIKDKGNFEALAISHAASFNGDLENYREGELSYNGFEAWLYDDETVVGSFTETPLANSTTNATEYAIFFYYEDGEEAWKIDVRNSIFVEDYQAYYETLKNEHSVTAEEKVLNKIDF